MSAGEEAVQQVISRCALVDVAALDGVAKKYVELDFSTEKSK